MFFPKLKIRRWSEGLESELLQVSSEPEVIVVDLRCLSDPNHMAHAVQQWSNFPSHDSSAPELVINNFNAAAKLLLVRRMFSEREKI